MSGYNSYPGYLPSTSGSAPNTFIPLAGTGVGFPVTGNIQMSTNTNFYNTSLVGGTDLGSFSMNGMSSSFGINVNNLMRSVNNSNPNIYSEIGQTSTLIRLQTTAANGTYGSVLMDNQGASMTSNNGTTVKKASVDFSGFSIRTNAGLHIAFLNSDNITADRALQLPDAAGNIPVVSAAFVPGVVTANGYVPMVFGGTTIKVMTTA